MKSILFQGAVNQTHRFFNKLFQWASILSLMVFIHGPTSFISSTIALKGQMQTESCQLPAPSQLTAIVSGNSSATLNWSVVNGASAYLLMVYDLNTMEVFSCKVITGTTSTLDGLDAGVTYRCEISSMCTSSSVSSFIIVSEVVI